MVKKLEGVKWETVPLDGFPITMNDNFQGFVGLEECLVYDGLERPKKRTTKKKPQKRANTTSSIDTEVRNKKVKLSNGFVVESCEQTSPSVTNHVTSKDDKNIKNKKSKSLHDNNTNFEKKPNKKGVDKKKTKLKLGENVTQIESHLTPEDMLTWAEFKLPEPILKALAELGFKQPTKIQQLSLPAAIHGRRDILGAAETGSGKTLAFGLPILSGIMKLKEKAALGLDVYELPFKKISIKRQNRQINKNIIKDDKKTTRIVQKKVSIKKIKSKESSEEGYDSEDEESDKESDVSDDSSFDKNVEDKTGNNLKITPIAKKVSNHKDDFLEEIEVPLRKKDISTDEGNDSDDSENYVHLSEMLDSEDLVETSEDESKKNDTTVNREKESDEEILEEDENIEQEQGIGCVKVIDNVEMPGHVVTKTGKPLYALILTPTRELAIQISQHLKAVAKYTGIRIGTIVGGMATVKQERVLRSGPEVVVATPGRLWELITSGQTHLQQLHSVKFLAIDETDRMIERNHFEELYPLLERLNADEVRKSTRQNFVFSATLTMVHDLPAHMKGKKVTKRGKIINRKIEKNTAEQKVKRLISMIGMTDPKVVDITTQNLGTAETLTECRITCALEHKDAYLYYILKRHPGRTIVFCNSIGCVKRLAQLFNLLKCRPLPLHASMIQKQRLKNLERFRDDPRGVLVATDVAARGLDIPDVDHVIHYQVPRTAENYVHRSGRTARANKEGLTILMMEPSEAHLYAKLCRTLNKTSELPTFPVPPSSLVPLKELLSVARDIEVLMLKQKRGAQAVGWREKAAREMDIIIDEDDIPMTEVDPAISKALKVKKKHLDFMISRPLYPKGFSFKYPTLNDATALITDNDNALQVMKKAMESGEIKRQKRKSKNAPLLKLGKMLKNK